MVAADLPSGVDADTGAVFTDALRAATTADIDAAGAAEQAVRP